MASLTTFHRRGADRARHAAGRAAGLFSPSLRLGVTGLSRAGKTVFISALVHNLIHGGRLPLFEAQKSGRIARAFLEEQPDDAVPRFQYEDHVEALVTRPRLAGFDARHLRAAADHRVSNRPPAGTACSPAEDCRSTSSTIPANGCSTCRCSARSYAEFSRDAFDLAALPVRADLSQRLA